MMSEITQIIQNESLIESEHFTNLGPVHWKEPQMNELYVSQALLILNFSHLVRSGHF